MKGLDKYFLCFFLLVYGCSSVDKNFENLLKSPDKFHGQEIEITGIYREKFEDLAVYFNGSSDKDKAIWLNFSKLFLSLNTFNGFDGAMVKVKGTFNKNDKGHLGQYAGSLDDAWVLFDEDYARLK
ncbi:MAG: hypothetical protein ACK514_11795 [Bacteroidota bacterium]|jgi:hypothetical protein|nr:hypothetical protein [Cytophagales bacterium]MCE2958746.1 hypothetical protein [Flammeovirgaceae bacterium]MCZ8071227.1 hypothetical protein [Cytophagales bacterium]